jgi:hypothetical protein
MKITSRRLRRMARLFFSAVAFVVGTYVVSNLMPLLLRAAESGLNASAGALIVGDMVAVTVSVTFLAREIYRMDERAGRIRNRVGWFE